MSSDAYPPKVAECLADILDYVECAAIKDGRKTITITDLFYIIARFDDDVEDYLIRNQIPIPLGNNTFCKLHYRSKECANDE